GDAPIEASDMLVEVHALEGPGPADLLLKALAFRLRLGRGDVKVAAAVGGDEDFLAGIFLGDRGSLAALALVALGHVLAGYVDEVAGSQGDVQRRLLGLRAHDGKGMA